MHHSRPGVITQRRGKCCITPLINKPGNSDVWPTVRSGNETNWIFYINKFQTDSFLIKNLN